MGKKLRNLVLLTGALLAGISMSKYVSDSVRNIHYSKPANSNEIVREVPPKNYQKESGKKQKILAEEKNLLKKDSIYRIIDSSYEKMDVPEYISKKFVRTLIKTESKDNPRAVSYMGARGLGQLMKKTWYEVERDNYWKNAFIPEKNIEATIKYLILTDKRCNLLHPSWKKLSKKEKLNLISASYNGGIGNLKNAGWDIDKMPRETRRYIPKLERIAESIIPSEEIY